MNPKTFARLMRFSRATDLARENSCASPASIAVAAGYYGQAHLIEDFCIGLRTCPSSAFKVSLRSCDDSARTTITWSSDITR
jgi:hypothetical protein